MAHPGGRPLLFNTPGEMQIKIIGYFKICDEKKKPYTMAGLAYYLGFSQRTQLPDYAKDHEEFSDTIMRARLKIEEQRSEALVNPDTKNVNGMKFDLQNNFGWTDKQEIDQTNRYPDGINIRFTDGNDGNE